MLPRDSVRTLSSVDSDLIVPRTTSSLSLILVCTFYSDKSYLPENLRNNNTQFSSQCVFKLLFTFMAYVGIVTKILESRFLYKHVADLVTLLKKNINCQNTL